MLDEFCKLVEIDSVSFHERKMADELKKILQELSFEVHEDNANEIYHSEAGNVYGFLKGELPGPPLLFSAHMDTVAPGLHKKAVVKEDGTVTSDGTTVLGADDLSGIVAILEAIRSIREQGIKHRSVEVLFPIAEEVYIRGSEVFDYNVIKAKEAYVLDLTGPIGDAAIKAPTLVSFTVTVHGKSAHAGFAPEKGIHAIKIVAQMISRMEQGHIDEETTLNIGMIEGGLARNIVPNTCIFYGEIRSYSHESALLQALQVKDLCERIAREEKAEVTFEQTFGCIAYEIEKEERVVTRYEEVCKELEIPVTLTKTFGGSDNNNFVLHGIRGIVIACGMNQVHSTGEYTSIQDLGKISRIVYKLMTNEN